MRRRFLVLAAAALGATLATALVGGWRAGMPHHYWADGFFRLLADLVCERFDRWAPWALGAAAALALWPRWPVPRGLVRAALVLLVVVVGLRAAVALDAWRASRGPNLLLISIDTLRADRLGAYGYDLPTSPAFDRRLAAEGVTFTDVYSQSPKTTPSHMTMLTGLYPCVHGVELWWGTAPAHRLNPAVHTLAEVLREAGYATAAFTGGAHLDHTRGFDQGFQVYEDVGNDTQLGHALRWLKRHHRRRFFLFFHTYRVHDPYVPPPALVQQFGEGYRGPVLDAVNRLRADASAYEERSRLFWASVDPHDPAAVRFVSRLYDAGVRDMDDVIVNGLLDALERFGLARDTLVVFTSDHGEAFGEHGHFLHDDVYRGTVHVPLVLRFPGRLPAGRRVAARARIVDVTPTILDLLDLPPEPDVQGRSLVRLIDGGGVGLDAVSEHRVPGSDAGEVCLRRGALGYVVDGTGEALFDLAADPGETTNLATSRPEAMAALRTEVAAWRAECARLGAILGPRDAGVAPSAERVRQLRALGYVQ
ncbi:MAG TPA: sulfatase [Candidatus Binatia bacterium]|nr:sulfatase [Candidatus Binatia bacterium]